MKTTLLKIMGYAGAALIIPVSGNIFVDGWNWTWHDFIFAWVFWVVMGTTVLLAAQRFQMQQWFVGVLVFLGFAAIWAMLATG